MIIDKKILHNLASLARIELNSEKEAKLLSDLESILDNFEELKKVDTEEVVPMALGVELVNIFREDNDVVSLDNDLALKAFPEKDGEFLKIPPVFVKEDEEI